eukprot:5745439-Pyramimonas_sp.AAC.1
MAEAIYNLARLIATTERKLALSAIGLQDRALDLQGHHRQDFQQHRDWGNGSELGHPLGLRFLADQPSDVPCSGLVEILTHMVAESQTKSREDLFEGIVLEPLDHLSHEHVRLGARFATPQLTDDCFEKRKGERNLRLLVFGGPLAMHPSGQSLVAGRVGEQVGVEGA